MIELTQRFLGVYVNERTADSLPNAQTNPTAQSCKRPIKSFYLENYQDSDNEHLRLGVSCRGAAPPRVPPSVCPRLLDPRTVPLLCASVLWQPVQFRLFGVGLKLELPLTTTTSCKKITVQSNFDKVALRQTAPTPGCRARRLTGAELAGFGTASWLVKGVKPRLLDDATDLAALWRATGVLWSACDTVTGPNRGALDGPVTWQKEPAGSPQLPLA